MGELDAQYFYKVLTKLITTDTLKDTANSIEVEGEIVNNQLVLDLPTELEPITQITDIFIFVGNRHISVKWKNGDNLPIVR